jgi:hypothetical protein
MATHAPRSKAHETLTADELAAGRARRGGRVSKHNKWCDHAARKAGVAYLAQVTP